VLDTGGIQRRLDKPLCANISETTLPWKLEYNRGRRRTKCLKTNLSRPQFLSQVVPQAERRQFTAKYKLRILEKADSCNGAGELGADAFLPLLPTIDDQSHAIGQRSYPIHLGVRS